MKNDRKNMKSGKIEEWLDQTLYLTNLDRDMEYLGRLIQTESECFLNRLVGRVFPRVGRMFGPRRRYQFVNSEAKINLKAYSVKESEITGLMSYKGLFFGKITRTEEYD